MARKKRENRFLAAVKAMGPMRILLSLVVAVIGGWLAIELSISGIGRYKNPEAALALMPGDSIALAARADQLLAANQTRPNPQVQRLATRALKEQAMNAKAIRILGYVAEAKGDRPLALAFMQLAERLSRREPGAQLWLIEYHAQANNTTKTLKHYDILLKTKPDTQTLLFPRLSNAIADAPIRTALLPYVRKDVPWTSSFLWHAINTDKNLSNIVDLIIENGGFPKNKPGDNSSREQEKRLIGRLVSENRFADARRIFALVPGANPALLTNAGFEKHDRDGRFGAMGWQIMDDPNAGSGFGDGKGLGKGQGKPTLSIFANSATTRVVASKLLYLAPGSYRVDVKFAQFERGDDGYVKLQMRCPAMGGGAPLWTFNVDPKRGQGQFEVPASCPAQFLDIIGSGGEGRLGLEAVIGSVVIAP